MNVENATTQTLNSIHKCVTVGQTLPDITPQDGWTMSNVGAWLKAEKSFVITNAHILLSIFLILIFAAAFSFILSRQAQTIEINGHRYEITGMAQTQDQGKIIYMPVFKEIKS